MKHGSYFVFGIWMCFCSLQYWNELMWKCKIHSHFNNGLGLISKGSSTNLARLAIMGAPQSGDQGRAEYALAAWEKAGHASGLATWLDLQFLSRPLPAPSTGFLQPGHQWIERVALEDPEPDQARGARSNQLFSQKQWSIRNNAVEVYGVMVKNVIKWRYGPLMIMS